MPSAHWNQNHKLKNESRTKIPKSHIRKYITKIQKMSEIRDDRLQPEVRNRRWDEPTCPPPGHTNTTSTLRSSDRPAAASEEWCSPRPESPSLGHPECRAQPSRSSASRRKAGRRKPPSYTWAPSAS